MIRGQCQTKGKTDSLTKEKSRIINKFLNLSNKDVIADIGTGSGYSLIPIANECAGCKFTVEDIDSISCNPIALSRRIAKTGNKITINNFSFYYGTERSTNLPSATYNKVLIFDVIHEMTYKTEMLYDIKRILQKNGTVFIEEILVHRKIKKDRICNYPFLTEPAFKEILAANKFMILREEMTFDTGNNRFIKIFECAPGL
jgi:ubiquinone/menaquinone biosynthesis C-methylase UbiE